MSDIHGFAAHAAGAELLAYKYNPGELNEDEVEISITHCGVCYSDIHLIDNDWGNSKYPFIPGHEIVGTIVALGARVKARTLGQRVGVGWESDSCGICQWCQRGEQQLCASNKPTCVGRNGGYAQGIRVNWRFAVPIPDALESENAAPLLCAGITVYSPLRNFGTQPSSRVGIIGIGGLGHIGIQFARAFGAEVTAFSTSKDKEAEARELGAHHFVNTRDTGALKKVGGSFDLLITTVNANQDWAGFVGALRPRGTMVFLGVPAAPVTLPVNILLSNKSVAGSMIGSPGDLAEMLDVAARHNVKAITERFAMDKANEAITRVKKGQVRYRAVLTN